MQKHTTENYVSGHIIKYNFKISNDIQSLLRQRKSVSALTNSDILQHSLSVYGVNMCIILKYGRIQLYSTYYDTLHIISYFNFREEKNSNIQRFSSYRRLFENVSDSKN